MVKFSNPRPAAEFNDWPLGGNKRGTCKFGMDYRVAKGWRFYRITTGKPKTRTYGGKGCIVDGDDGRTYLLQHASDAGFVSVIASDFMDASPKVVADDAVSAAVFPKDARYQELSNLIAAAHEN